MQIVIISGIGIIVLSYIIFKNKRRAEITPQLSLEKEETFLHNCKIYNLSSRETEVTRLMLQGWTYKAVAGQLFIAEKTVDSHMQNIYSKTGVRNKLSLYNLLYRDYP